MNDRETIQTLIDSACEYAPAAPAKSPAVEAVTSTHPLTNFVHLDLNPRPPEWLIDNLIQVGLVTMAGTRGVGKTTALLPIAAAIAGLSPPDFQLKVSIRRHVVWVTEDIHQANRVLAALVKYAGWSNADEVRKWFHVVSAARLDADVIAQVSSTLDELLTVEHVGCLGNYKAKPLIVFDTANACFKLDNESDNSEVGRFLGTIKNSFHDFPILIITHMPKALNASSEVGELTSRGASAWESDAHQCVYLVDDKGQRVMLLGKRRFETDLEGLRFETHVHTESVMTHVGEQLLKLRYSLASLMSHQERTEARMLHLQQAQEARQSEMEAQAISIAQEAFDKGLPLSASELRSLMRGKNQSKGETIRNLELAGRLVSIEVPAAIRVNSAKKSYVVPLTPEEQRTRHQTGQLPAHKATIPRSWRRD